MAHEIDGKSENQGRRHRIQSVEVAARILFAFVKIGRAMSLSELAAATGMAPAKLHRYLASLVDVGFVEQSKRASSYRLGAGAIEIGVAALRQNEFVEVAGHNIIAVRDAMDVTCFAAVLGNHGPTVVRQAVANQTVALHVRVGSVLPIGRSATGWVFGAHLSSKQITEFLKAQRDKHEVARPHFEIARKRGMAIIKDGYMQGISAIAVPVLINGNEIAGVLTALGPTGTIDISPKGPVALALLEAAHKTSLVVGGALSR